MLNSNKIFLRRMEKEDLKLKVKWVNDEEINETLLFDYPISLSETEEWYKKTFFDRNRWDFVIVEKEDNAIIGMTGLINLNYRHKNAQFFITIGEKKKWGKGYSKEVIPLILEFAFIELGLEKVYLKTLPNNKKARHIYERIGFKQEALMRKHYYLHGKLNDIYQHSILCDEYMMKYHKKWREYEEI